jgi:hypothetical protein
MTPGHKEVIMCKFINTRLLMSMLALIVPNVTHAASQLKLSQPYMTRCLSSEAGPFTKVDFRKDRTDGLISMQVTVVLGFTDRWLHIPALGKNVLTPEPSSWDLYKITASPIEGQELNWFGISDQGVETGYNGTVLPGFLDIKMPSGESHRFMLECYELPDHYWRAPESHKR